MPANDGEFYSTTKIYGYLKKDSIIEDYKFWLGLFNSHLFWFFIQNTGYVLRGGYFTFKTDYILPFPVPKSIDIDLYESIISAVESILKIKADGVNKDTFELEEMINKYIYLLYGFNKKDIDVIENSKC